MSLFGCGSYEAYIVPRGGGAIVATVDWSQLTWSRVLDDTSDGSVLVDAECIGSLASTRSWQHELALYRDNALVWVGPVVTPSAPVTPDHLQFHLAARGISAWWDHRFVHHNHEFEHTDLAAIFQAISDDAMSVDNSPGLTISTTLSGVLGTLNILASQHAMAGQQLRDLSNTGIDWTEIGRTILAGGLVVPTESLGVFRDEHFISPPLVTENGLQKTNSWVVRGNGSGAAGDSIAGVAIDGTAGLLDGVLESVDTVTTIEDNISAQAAAKSRLALTSAVDSVQNAVLATDAPFSIDQLVPGALCDLALTETNIPVRGLFRLQSVHGAAATDGVEQVTLTLQPVGAT